MKQLSTTIDDTALDHSKRCLSTKTNKKVIHEAFEFTCTFSFLSVRRWYLSVSVCLSDLGLIQFCVSVFLSSLSPGKEDGPTLANISETSVTYPAYMMLGLQQ